MRKQAPSTRLPSVRSKRSFTCVNIPPISFERGVLWFMLERLLRSRHVIEHMHLSRSVYPFFALNSTVLLLFSSSTITTYIPLLYQTVFLAGFFHYNTTTCVTCLVLLSARSLASSSTSDNPYISYKSTQLTHTRNKLQNGRENG